MIQRALRLRAALDELIQSEQLIVRRRDEDIEILDDEALLVKDLANDGLTTRD